MKKLVLIIALFTPVILLAQLTPGTKAHGGIVVYEKYGHGLVVLERDLGKLKLADAIKACDDLVSNGFSDWRLPVPEEMEAIYKNLHKKGLSSFKPSYYWVLKDINETEALDFSFRDGSSTKGVRGNPPRVIPVRTF